MFDPCLRGVAWALVQAGCFGLLVGGGCGCDDGQNQAVCGNGIIEGDETCDGSDLAGASCASLGYDGGELGCAATCEYDRSDCYACGNGVIERDEECDLNDFGGQTCADFGHGGGALSCTSSCQILQDECYDCGDGVCETALGEHQADCLPDCGWATIAAGLSHACALRHDGTVWCWGDHDKGQLGTGSAAPETCGILPCSTVPLQVAGLTEVVQLSTGRDHACAVRDDGTGWCWGGGDFGKLGNGVDFDTPLPVQVQGLQNFAAISAGAMHSCAVKVDGTVWCWGYNRHGQLGLGLSDGWVIQPTQVALGIDATAVAAGADHSCALLIDGSVWCWGGNIMGQLGIGNNTGPESCTTTSIPCSTTPLQVPGLQDAQSISASARHHLYTAYTCAVLIDGSVRCWGINEHGELGIGSVTAFEATPVPVLNLSAVALAATGFWHSCTVESGGNVWCWGSNSDGQLGDGTTTDSATPIQVQSLPAVDAVTVGGSFTCARGLNGLGWCWGSGSQGTLGHGSSLDSLVPVMVVD